MQIIFKMIYFLISIFSWSRNICKYFEVSNVLLASFYSSQVSLVVVPIILQEFRQIFELSLFFISFYTSQWWLKIVPPV